MSRFGIEGFKARPTEDPQSLEIDYAGSDIWSVLFGKSQNVFRGTSGNSGCGDDGKGSRIEFAYERAPATPGIDRRPSLLASLTLDNTGYDVVSHRYDYDQPYFHSAAQFLVGFGLVWLALVMFTWDGLYNARRNARLAVVAA